MFEDVPAVVIDNGTGMIKAGMAGDEAPKAYFPTVVGYVKFNKIIGTDGKDCVIGDDAIQKKGLLSLKYPLENGIVQNWGDMEKIWRYCYFDQLKTDPEIHPVLLTEAALNPKKNREKMMEIFFDEFKVPGFYVFTQAVLALYSSGRTTGLVCDSGDGVSHIVVVYDGYSIKHAISRMDLAGRDMTEFIQKHLAEDGHSFQSTSEKEIARDIKERLCYVAMNYEEELQAFESDESLYKEYELPDTNTIKIGDVLIRTSEIMFKPHLVGKDINGIHEQIVQCINKTDLDLRPTLLQNITLSGGSTMFPNYQERLQQEILSITPNNSKIKIIAPAERKFSIWIGGSVLSTLATFQSNWITKQEYQEVGPAIVHRKCFQIFIVINFLILKSIISIVC